MQMFAVDGWQALRNDFAELTDFGVLSLALVRLVLAAILGGVLGYEREKAGKSAGMRTHMLVSLGAAFFVLAPQLAEVEEMGRVIQGVITGVGFIGGGAILKLSDEHRVKGLTTSAGLWLSAAIGMGVGLGRLGISFLCTVISLIILSLLYYLQPEKEAE